MTDNEYDKIIRMLKDELADCDEPDVSARPIAYGTILGLKMAVSIVETVRGFHKEELKLFENKIRREFAERLVEKADITPVNAFSHNFVISQEDIDSLLKETENE